MFGSYSAELTPEVKPWAHSKDSMRLVGPPVGMMERSSPMQSFEDYYKVLLHNKKAISKSSNPTILIHLKKKN